MGRVKLYFSEWPTVPLGKFMLESVKMRTKRPHKLAPEFPPVEVALLEKLFDQAADMAFFVKDAEGRCVAVNDSLVRRHGLKHKGEVIGKRPSEICPGDLGRIPAEQDAKVLRTGKPLLDHLEMHWDQPHQPVWCLTTKLPVCDAQGKVTGLVGFSRDLRVPVERQEIPPAFVAAWEYLEEHLDESPTPAEFARRSQLTPARLARLTKRLFGLTPSLLLAKTRLTAATRMLLETDKTVAEIAVACGFYDHSAFTRAFRSATGMTPTEFRKQK